MSRRARLIPIIVILTMMLGACAGPRSGIEVGSKDVAVDIVLGDQAQTLAPLPGGGSPVTGFPGFIAPPVPRPEPGAPPPPPPPPQACPLADPLDASKLVALKRAPRPPVPATYLYRNHGTLKVGDGAETAYPPEQTRTVLNVKPDAAGNYEFDVAALLAGVTTTTTYRVLNEGSTPDRGVYIIGTVTRYPNGDTEGFNPDEPILLMPFPPPEYGTNLEDELDRQRGASYRSAGTDPLSQTTMAVEAQVEGKDRANACGEWVDAYSIKIVSGKIVGPLKNIDFTGTYLIAPQYGALVVEDNLTFTGTDDLKNYYSKNRTTINVVPKEPAVS
jgi:hypothetical protein